MQLLDKITLSGFALLVSLFTCTLVLWGPGLHPPSDGTEWLGVLGGVTILAYFTLDNMDGKQARRTSSSSPLGMIFDHGFDSGATVLITAFMVQLYAFQGLKAHVLLLLFSGAFFAKTVEHCACGILNLGRINAVDEGVPFVALLSLVSSFVRPLIDKPLPYIVSLQFRDVLFVAVAVTALGALFTGVQTTIRERGPRWTVEAWLMYIALVSATLLALMSSCSQGKEKWIFLAFNAIHMRLSYHLMLSLIADEPPNPFLPYPSTLIAVLGLLGVASTLVAWRSWVVLLQVFCGLTLLCEVKRHRCVHIDNEQLPSRDSEHSSVPHHATAAFCKL